MFLLQYAGGEGFDGVAGQDRHLRLAQHFAAVELFGDDVHRRPGMAVAGLVGAPLMFMAGGEMTVPAGTSANAKITANVAMTPEVTANCGGNRVPKE